MSMLAVLLLLFSQLLSTANSLKILVYSPKYAHSHMVYLGAVADTLQLAGHDVVRDFFDATYFSCCLQGNGLQRARNREIISRGFDPDNNRS